MACKCKLIYTYTHNIGKNLKPTLWSTLKTNLFNVFEQIGLTPIKALYPQIGSLCIVPYMKYSKLYKILPP
jgi:hypothetical protein